MMIAEDLMEDQEGVLVAEVKVVLAPVVAVQAVVIVLQMEEAETAQPADHLLVQEADAVVLQTDGAVLQMDAVVLPRQEAAAVVLQAMEDVAAKKVVLLQADKFCIETIKENRASALFFLSHDFLKNILWQQKPQPVQMVRKKAANWKNFSLIS